MNNEIYNHQQFIKQNILKGFVGEEVPQPMFSVTEKENIELIKGMFDDMTKGHVELEVFEKAVQDISRYKKVRRIEKEENRTFLRSYNIEKGVVDDMFFNEVELASPVVPDIEYGSKVSFDKEGTIVKGYVIDIKHHSLTDRFGTAIVHTGREVYNVSLRRLKSN